MRATLIYDGEDLASAPYGAELITSNVPGTPTARIDVQEVPYGRGVSQGQYYLPLILTALMEITGTSNADVRDKLDRIAGVFDVDSDKTLVFDQLGYSDRRWLARRSNSSPARWLNARAVQVTWNFIAADPIAESTTLTTEDYNPANDAWTFYVPDTAGTVVGGNSVAYPIYLLKGTGANAAPIKIENVTRDEEISWIWTLALNEWLRIDTTLYSVERSLNLGVSWTSVIANLDSTSKFPLLDEGVRNQFLLTDCDDTTLTVTYRARYLGG